MAKEIVNVNVEEIMKEIRSKIQAEELAANMPSFSQIPINGENGGVSAGTAEGENWEEFMESLRYMNVNYSVPYYWDLGPKGIKTFVKRVVRKLIKCIVMPIVERQGQINACVVRCMNTVRYFIEGQRRINDKLREDNEHLAHMAETQSNQIRDLQDELKQTAQQYQELQEKTNMYVSNLIELQEKIGILEREGVFVSSARDESILKMSAAQSGEDMILDYIMRMLGVRLQEVLYLDLGANHAKEISNTYYFYKNGARGVLVEANPELIGELKFYRNADVILNRCIANKSGEVVNFYIMNGDGLSSPDRESAEAAIAENSWLKIEKMVSVQTITVQEILDTYFDKAPTVLNLDIEGREMDILESFDFTRYRPLILIIETIPYRRHLVVGEKNNEIVEFMRSKGYTEYAFTGINSIFLDQRQVDKILENCD